MALPKRKKQKIANVTDTFITNADDADTDPDAARRYKKIGVGFNKYEYDLLIKLADHYEESVLNTIRQAIVEDASRQRVK